MELSFFLLLVFQSFIWALSYATSKVDKQFLSFQQQNILLRKSHRVLRKIYEEQNIEFASNPENIENNFVEQRLYNDTVIDKLWIQLFGNKIANAINIPKNVRNYDELVDVSKQIMVNRDPKDQRERVKTVLESLMPPFVRQSFRLLFPDTKLACEINAAITPVFFGWLVGPSKCVSGEVERGFGPTETWKSVVKIEKCRYLEQSQCKGLCTNLCKFPTQDFFTKELGMPLYMEPNFEDFSCKMIFGQTPPPIEKDAVLEQCCFVQCSKKENPNTDSRCPQIPTS